MFGLVSGLYKTLNAEIKLSILVVGCDDAGKTALLERCKVTKFSSAKASRKKLSKNSKDNNSNSIINIKNTTNENNSTRRGSRRVKGFCPSPASYSPYYTVADDDSITEAIPKGTSSHLVVLAPTMEKAADAPDATKKTTNVILSKQTGEHQIDINIRPGAKMLPLHMITPTVGLNLAKKVDAFGCKCDFWDLGGQERMRGLWERYYADADAVVFVVDVTATESKLKDASGAFQQMRSDEQLNGVPILIFANKMDTFDDKKYFVSNVDDLIDILNIFSSSDQQHQYKDNGIIDLDDVDLIRLCSGSAKTGEGIHDAFEWLITTATEQSLKPPR